MAADVRNNEDLETCSVSDSLRETDVSSIDLLSNTGTYNSHSVSLPAYMIVQSQLRDVILTQKKTVEQLVRSNISVLDASKESFHAAVQSQQEQIQQLEKSITTDFVPRNVHESLQETLQEETEKHVQIQNRLQEVLDKYEGSVNQITALTLKAEADRAAFDSGSDTLKKELSVAHARIRELETKLNEKATLCHQQGEEIQLLQLQMKSVQLQSEQQQKKYKEKTREMQVEKEQEAYLSRMMGGKGDNKKK